MRHHTGDIAGGVTDAGNVTERTIGIGVVREFTVGISVLKKDLAIFLNVLQRFGITKIIALTVGNGNAKQLVLRDPAGKRCVVIGRLQPNMLTTKF